MNLGLRKTIKLCGKCEITFQLLKVTVIKYENKCGCIEDKRMKEKVKKK